HRAERAEGLRRRHAADLDQLRDDPSPVCGESELRPRTRQRVERDAIAATQARLDESFGRLTRTLLVAGRKVQLIEDEYVQMTPRGALIRRHFAGHGVTRDLGVRLGRLFDVLEQHDGTDVAMLGDFHLVLAQIANRTAVCVDDAYVETRQLHARSE